MNKSPDISKRVKSVLSDDTDLGDVSHGVLIGMVNKKMSPTENTCINNENIKKELGFGIYKVYVERGELDRLASNSKLEFIEYPRMNGGPVLFSE